MGFSLLPTHLDRRRGGTRFSNSTVHSRQRLAPPWLRPQFQLQQRKAPRIGWLQFGPFPLIAYSSCPRNTSRWFGNYLRCKKGLLVYEADRSKALCQSSLYPSLCISVLTLACEYEIDEPRRDLFQQA